MADVNGGGLLRAIQMYDFYLYELNLYLDTHPNDSQALSLFKKDTTLKLILINLKLLIIKDYLNYLKVKMKKLC